MSTDSRAEAGQTAVVHSLAAKRAEVARQSAGEVTPAQRAAVIIAMLGEEAARPIVDKLGDRELTRVVAALESISVLSREALVEIVVDFLTSLHKSSGALRGGRDTAREIVGSLVDSRRLSVILGEAPRETGQDPAGTEDTGDVWSRLARRKPAAIAAYLSGLTPNLIALILRKLDVAASSEVLCHLDEARLVPTMGFLVDVKPMDPGIESVVARMVEMEFLNGEPDADEEDQSHLEAIGEMLTLIPDEKRESLVAYLKREHETKLRRIEQSILTIEALPAILPRNSVPVVFRELEGSVLTKLLGTFQTAYPQVAEYLLGNISSRMADQYRDDLTDFKPLPEAEAEALQREFLTTLMGLKQRGVITLERPAPEPDKEEDSG